MRRLAAATAAFICAMGTATAARAELHSKVSGTTGELQAAGSDAASAEFMQNELPGLQDLMEVNLGSKLNLAQAQQISLDPTRLIIEESTDLRVYFIGEDTGFEHSLGIKISNDGAVTQEGFIFRDGRIAQNNQAELSAGDFNDVGFVEGGSRIDFQLLSNGGTGGQTTLYSDADHNADGLPHLVAFASYDSPYLLLSFEDRNGGGDMDYNDFFFAVEIGIENVEQIIIYNPEPSVLLLSGLGGLLAWRRRRRTLSRA
jgi:hypothetical protein